MLITKIGNKNFISSAVSLSKLKYVKSIFRGGYHFEFPHNRDAYPLEFGLSQIDSIKNFDLVFTPDINNKGFIGVFLKTLERKSIFVEKQNFEKQLNKYVNIFEKIAILNYTENNYNKDIAIINLEKIPTLYDPAKKSVITRRYLLLFLFSFAVFVLSGIKITSLEETLNINKAQLEKEKTKFNELSISIKENTLPFIPNQGIKQRDFEKLLEKVDKGEIK